MSSARDDTTISFYGTEADAYTSRDQPSANRLTHFVERLPAGASVLELGCGAGQDSEAMLALGFDVTPSDGTPEMASAAAQRLGRPVKVLLFDDIEGTAVYHGVWANACLLHVPRSDLAGIIAKIRNVLQPGGIFYASYKAGKAEGRDRFGRYYNYPSAEWLSLAYDAAIWRSVEIEEASGSGYDGLPTDWLHVTATKGR